MYFNYNHTHNINIITRHTSLLYISELHLPVYTVFKK